MTNEKSIFKNPFNQKVDAVKVAEKSAAHCSNAKTEFESQDIAPKKRKADDFLHEEEYEY